MLLDTDGTDTVKSVDEQASLTLLAGMFLGRCLVSTVSTTINSLPPVAPITKLEI